VHSPLTYYYLPGYAPSRTVRMLRTLPRTSPLARWKGKARAVHSEESRDEGTGGPDGIVLPLDMVGAGMYEA
jgi:hypothetical protein